MLRKTRIVATIGPASSSEEMIEKLLEAGMNVARLNFSHGTHHQHAEVFARLRSISERLGKPLGILQDLCGPKIRLGEMKPDTHFGNGELVRFVSHEMVGDAHQAEISYDGLFREVRVGDRILIDDGLLELVVEEIEGEAVLARVRVGGPARSRKGVNLPGVALSVPALTDKDREDLRFGLELGVDLVALSFVRRPGDLEAAREAMREAGRRVPLIVKIEKPEALLNLEEIVTRADGVMVARGDLGVEMPLEEVPLIQKKLINLCVEKARPVITATQMLESMVVSARPTRAEVNDVANAILDGTDAVMLSAETATGAYPDRAVEVMSRIAARTEESLDWLSIHKKTPPKGHAVEAVALAACEVAEEISAGAILACSSSGRTVRAISRYRPRARILGITTDPQIARRFSVSWGVTPIVVSDHQTTDELIELAMEAARQHGVPTGQPVVIAAGVPVGSPTNMVTVRTL
ncbi:MAG: pyruvate kinase [Vulcanimicrobiota bacterium]